MPQPRRHRMRRPARLDSARAWLDSGATVTLRGYARRYGVDRPTSYQELTMLGVDLPAGDERWSSRLPPGPARQRPERDTDQGPDPDGGLPDGWMEWGGQLMFVAGFTSGGAPFGLRVDEFPEEDLPDALREARRLAESESAGGFQGEIDPPF